MTENPPQTTTTHKQADDDGHFRRKPSHFRNFISKDPSSEFPAVAGRYVLYINYGCPWAHRTILVRRLKGLDDIVGLAVSDFELTNDGWLFTGKNGSTEKDPLYGFSCLRQLYEKADPTYEGRYLVPCLWDKQRETIVNNESSEIIRMFYTEFDDLLPDQHLRESFRASGGFYPLHLRTEIDAMNAWVYDTVNNGVYKCGFATTQAAYDANVYPLFESLDRLETHLAPSNPANHGGPYLFGAHLTEADVRLYTTLIRFDAAYHTLFQCNRKTIRGDYPNLYRWLRRCYWRGGEGFGAGKTTVFKDTTNFFAYRYGYARAKARMYNNSGSNSKMEIIVPAGPAVDIDPMDDDDNDNSDEKGANGTAVGTNGDNVASATANKIERIRTDGNKRDAVAAVFAAATAADK